MALRINTNIASMNAHKNMIKTDNSLSESLARLSSGLRINKAADDASGMAIADSLRSQALGLGQAIRNGNDGIAIVQTADAALEESINIVNTIKQKSIQSAQDGQTTESRKARNFRSVPMPVKPLIYPSSLRKLQRSAISQHPI